MDKGRNSKPYTAYNKAIIERLMEKYNFTSHFIYASLRGDRTSENSIKICDDYKQVEIEINKAFQEFYPD